MLYTLIDCRITKTDTINLNVPDGDYKVKLNQNLLSPDPDNTHSKFLLSFEMYPEAEEKADEKTFYVFVEASGIYQLESDLSPDSISRELAHDLFPFLRASVSTIMTSAGMPPYILPPSLLD